MREGLVATLGCACNAGATVWVELLAAWAPRDHASHDCVCVVCEGETFRVELRGGLPAQACRACGSVLEDESALLVA